MKLVEEALGRPEAEREHYLKEQCASHPEDFARALDYVEWEQRMQGFLLEPVIKREEGEPTLQGGDLLQNRFRIVREVAQGGMGVVYEAQDEKLGRRIALKCAKAGFGNELPPEVRHATEVSHPNVCKLYEIHTATIGQQMVDFITMEFLEGEMLATRLKRGLIPRPESFVIARQLAAGVAEAHRNGVIHGDLKSNNVILTKLLDGKSRGIWGTPGYMAPELWLGEQPSVASDIYALGVVFFEMATGEIPSQNETSKAVSGSLKATPWLEAVSHRPPPVSAQWDGILGRCLDPDPRKRFRSADDLVQALTPGHARRNTLLAAAAFTAAALTGVITYRSATAPQETIKLAVVAAGDPAGNFI
jgi:serine/threonine protein kinase